VRDPRERERAGREGAVAGLAVARHGLHQEPERRAGRAVGELAVPAHSLAPAEEARAEHVVRTATRHRIEHAREVRGVVLAVAVEVDRGGVALVARELEPRTKRGAETTRNGVRDDPRAVLATDLGRAIARAVVDEQDIDGKPTRLARDAANDSTDGSLLIARHHNGEAPSLPNNPA
jgi:hypothetical protein